jgi:predicted nucleotidyltransferase
MRLKKEELMVSQNTMDEAIRRLVKAYNPLQIYLYGDYAEGTANEESSVEMLIVVESSDERIIKRGYTAFEALLGLRIPKNVVVFTKEEFDTYAQDPTSRTYEIKTRGKLLYARD